VSLISKRPDHWNSIVGQDKALRLLQAVIKNPDFLLRGFIFSGLVGVGKTSTAYLLTRALLCLGKNPLSCSSCVSCTHILENGLSTHPDFKEDAGVEKAGVVNSREIISNSEALPILGRRRTILVDEAHRLSPEAWDVYLAPLEEDDTNSIFIFSSSNADTIPNNITSRCLKVRFGKVGSSIILGMLSNIANQNKIAYELEALKFISEHCKGIPRTALNILDLSASLGKVTKEVVCQVMDLGLEQGCIQLYSFLAEKKLNEAIQLADELSKAYKPHSIIMQLFSLFGQILFVEEFSTLKPMFINPVGTSDVFIKWSQVTNIPEDAVPLFIYELYSSIQEKVQTYTYSKKTVESNNSLLPKELGQLLGATLE
jgi:DNA polymerase-3 subunit gamma/tau